MAARAGVPKPSGYGPAHTFHTVQQNIPVFNGNKATFQAFSFACTSAFAEVSCDTVLVSSEEWKRTVDAAPMPTRSGQDQTTETGETLIVDKVNKDVLGARSNFVARVLLSRLSAEVSKNVRAILDDGDLLCGNKLWNCLLKYYSMPGLEAHKKVERNPETLLVSALNARLRKDETISAFVQRLRIEAAKIFKSPRLKDNEGARRFIVGALLHTVLEHALKDSPHKDLDTLRTELRKMLFDDTSLTKMDALDTVQQRIEEIEARRGASATAASSASGKQGQQRGWHGKGKPAAGGQHSPKQSPAAPAGASRDSKPSGPPFKGGSRPDGKGKARVNLNQLEAGSDDGAGGDNTGDSCSVNADAYVVSVSGQSQAVVASAAGGGQAVPDGSTRRDASISAVTHGIKTKPAKAFLCDSGATDHCVRLRSMFTDYTAGETVLHLPNGRTLVSPGRGRVKVQLLDSDGGTVTMTIHDALFVPQLSNNIFSTNKFVSAAKGNRVVLDKEDSALVLPTKHRIPLHSDGKLLWLVVQPNTPVATTNKSKKASSATTAESPQPSVALQDLHIRLGHLNYDDCKHLAHQCGIQLSPGERAVCAVCQTAKMAKQPVASEAHRDLVQPGAIIHTDIKGPVDEASLTGAKLAIVFIDERTRYTVVKELQSKDQCVAAFEEAIADFARIPGAPIKVAEGSILHGDSERVLQSKQMHRFLAERGISPRASPPYTHERNGIAERQIRTLFDMVRSLLQQSGLPNRYWFLALQHAVYIRNRVPSAALDGQCPLQVLTGKVPQEVTRLKRFGCTAYVKIDESARKTLSPKARKGIYVGCQPLSNSHRVLLSGPDGTERVYDTIHCVFDDAANGTAAEGSAETEQSAAGTASQHLPVLGRDPLLVDFDDDSQEFTDGHLNAVVAGVRIPGSYAEAVSSSQRDEWCEAIQAEVDSLTANDTFEVVPSSMVPVGTKVLNTRWVFSVKHNGDSIERYKARLVARGDTQRPGVDFNEVYAPVVNATTLRTMLALAAIRDYDLDQLDAVTAFLNAPLGQDLYIKVPQGFPGVGADQRVVLRLRKSLYGLRQAPREWNKMLADWLCQWGLQRSAVDDCLFVIPGKLWVAVWVDDFLVMSADPDIKRRFKTALAAAFQIRDLGDVRSFLGMEIVRDRVQRTLTVTSSQHILDMAGRFGVQDAKSAHTPLPAKLQLRPRHGDEESLPAQYPYRALIGSLLYVATWTRPDIAFAVSQLARFQDDPGYQHWKYAKQVLTYLKGTVHVGLHYSAARRGPDGGVQCDPVQLCGLCDASWGEELDTRKSHSAFVFLLGNAAISWYSKRQTAVALSSTESEIYALAVAVKEAMYLRMLLRDLTGVQQDSVPIYEDNQSTIAYAHAPQISARTKHIDIRYHYVKELVDSGVIDLRYLSTAEQAADGLTKNLDRVKLAYLRQTLLGTVSS